MHSVQYVCVFTNMYLCSLALVSLIPGCILVILPAKSAGVLDPWEYVRQISRKAHAHIHTYIHILVSQVPPREVVKAHAHKHIHTYIHTYLVSQVPPREVVSKGAGVILDYLREINRARTTAKLDLSCSGLTYVPIEVSRVCVCRWSVMYVCVYVCIMPRPQLSWISAAAALHMCLLRYVCVYACRIQTPTKACMHVCMYVKIMARQY